MAKILILIGAHFSTNPRPQKEVETLAGVGHDVTVRGFWFDSELARRDCILVKDKKWRFEPIANFLPTTGWNRLKGLRLRIERRIGVELYSRFGISSPSALGYGVKAMLKAARQARADLTIVHSEGGLWVGNQLLDEGFNVGVDFEDWFSEDLLPEARSGRPIALLKNLERRLAQKCRYRLTTSHALADALADAYNAPRPDVVYNVFPLSERAQIDNRKLDRRNPALPSFHWFSQNIGPGRGLETLFKSLSDVSVVAEIHLRGNYSSDAQQWLESLVPSRWREYMFIHPTVPNAELVSRIAEHDIGLALETNELPSRDLTVTNKFFQYIQAGLAVVATDTNGQREIFNSYPEIGRLIPANDGAALGRALDELLRDPNKLRAAKDAALRAFQERYNWEIQSATILQSAERALSCNYKN